MSDQLSLRLETDRLPDLPDLRPMQPRPLPEPFDSDEHLFEPWWGGVRAFVLIGPADAPGDGVVRIVDADGVDLSAALPELAGMAVRVAARSAILDGELVVVDAARSGGSRPPWRPGSPVASGRPAAFLAFDLLHLDGRSLLNTPLVRRREALRKVLRPGDEVVAVPAIATEGRALYDAAVAQGIAGILARQRMSPYLPGIRSRLWRFVAATPGSAASRTDEPDRPAEPAADRRGPGPRPDQPPAPRRRAVGRRDGRRRLSRRGAPPRRTPGCPGAGRTAGRRPRTCARRRRRRRGSRPRAGPRTAPISHGWTWPTISRASITNGLNGGTNDAIVVHVPAPPLSARTAVR